MEVPREQISLYGCAAASPTVEPDVVQVTDLVEKPSVDQAPSTLAVIGRYVLDPAVFAVLAGTAPGAGGEIQLTDALRVLATMPPEEGGGVHGVVFRGRRYDTGDKLSYLKAVVRLACDREDLGPPLRAWLAEFLRRRCARVRSVDDHLRAVLEGMEPLDPLGLTLLDAQGCLLAEDVVAPWPLPSFDNSAMDGYAVRAADVAPASEQSPVVLRVVDDVPAGFRATERVGPGTAIRIMTGAPLPAGADAVVPVESTDAGTESVAVRRGVARGTYVRREGDDVRLGDAVLSTGDRLGPRQIALLAAVGRGRVLVRPRAPGGGAVDGQRAGGARQPAGARPGAGLQRGDAGRGGPGGRRRRLPGRAGGRRRGSAAGHAGGPAGAGRPGRHDRGGEHGGLRHREVAAEPAR